MSEQPAPAQALKEQGNAAFKQGDYQSAINLYTQAIAVDPSISELFSNRGRCYKLLGRLEDCKRDCETALELKDTNIKAHLLCGQALLAMAKQSYNLELVDLGLKRITRASTLCPSQKLQAYEKDLNLYLLRGKKLKWLIQQEKLREERERLLKRIQELENFNQSVEESVKKDNFNKLLKFTEEEKKEIPPYFTCSLTNKLLIDPVLLPNGHSYERQALLEHIANKGFICPVTGETLDRNLIFPNTTLKKAVNDFLEKHPWAFEFSQQTLDQIEF